MNRQTAVLSIALLACVTAAPMLAAPASTTLPVHPRELKYKPLEYPAPNHGKHRHVLHDGVVAFVVEDPGLPLVNLTVTVRGGDYLDPAGKEGLAAMTASLLRSGGAGQLDAAQLDEEVDFLALDMRASSAARESTASVNVLAKDLDRGLELLFMALREPRFQQDRIDLYKTKQQQGLEHRNDSTTSIELREWKRLVYGDNHFESRQPTKASLAAITRDDLVAFHHRAWHPGNFIIAVSGAVKTDDVLQRLERRLEGWPAGEAAPAAPAPTHVPEKGVWLVNKDDVNQTRVSIGHLATTWNDPNRPALEVMNEILGGGGFTSRIVNRVRSDEGLAYSAGSSIGFGRTYPMSFRIGFQSKNRSVSKATSISLAEMKRMRDEAVGDSELSTAVNSLVEGFPQRFNSAKAKVDTFVQDELYGRPADYWEKYRPDTKAVTVADVQRVATKYLHPDSVTILAVGKLSEILAGDPDHPGFSLEGYAGSQGILEIPLPEPASLAYPHAPQPVKAPAASSPGGTVTTPTKG